MFKKRNKIPVASGDSLPSGIFYILLYPLFFVFNAVFSTITRVYPGVLGFALSNKLLVFITAFSILGGSWCPVY